jgi:hypothetical protein
MFSSALYAVSWSGWIMVVTLWAGGGGVTSGETVFSCGFDGSAVTEAGASGAGVVVVVSVLFELVSCAFSDESGFSVFGAEGGMIE